MIKSLSAAALLAAALMSAPVGHADVCAAAGGRHVSAGGCTNVAGDAAAVAIAASDTPYVGPGEIPCYTAEGTIYYTPPGDPC